MTDRHILTNEQIYEAALIEISTYFNGNPLKWPKSSDACAQLVEIADKALNAGEANVHEPLLCVSFDKHDRYKRCLYRANGRLIQLGQEPEKLDYPSTDKCGIAANSGDDVLTPDPTTRPECRTGGVSALPPAQGASRDASSEKAGEHQWKIDGAHSNEYCGKCFVSKKSEACAHEWETIDEGGGGSEFQPPDPPTRVCCLCGQRQ